jgi:hypothetical protein
MRACSIFTVSSPIFTVSSLYTEDFIVFFLHCFFHRGVIVFFLSGANASMQHMRPFKMGTGWSLTALISMRISGRIGFVSLANVEYQPPPLPLFCFKWTCRHASLLYFIYFLFFVYLCCIYASSGRSEMQELSKGSSLDHRDLYSNYTT